MAGCRGTSPQEVLEARGDTGSLPTACPTSRVQPRDVIQRVQGDTPVNGHRNLINSRHSSVRTARARVSSCWILMNMKISAVGAVGNPLSWRLSMPLAATMTVEPPQGDPSLSARLGRCRCPHRPVRLRPAGAPLAGRHSHPLRDGTRRRTTFSSCARGDGSNKAELTALRPDTDHARGHGDAKLATPSSKSCFGPIHSQAGALHAKRSAAWSHALPRTRRRSAANRRSALYSHCGVDNV